MAQSGGPHSPRWSSSFQNDSEAPWDDDVAALSRMTGSSSPRPLHARSGHAGAASQASTRSSIMPDSAVVPRTPWDPDAPSQSEPDVVSSLHAQFNQFEKPHVIRMFNSEYYVRQLVDILLHTDENRHFGVAVRLEDLLGASPALGSLLSCESTFVINTLENVLRSVQEFILTGPGDVPERIDMRHKPHVHARIGHLFPLPGLVRPNVSSIRSSDMGRFIQVSGTVIRTGVIRMVERVRYFKCTHAKCGYEFPIDIEIEHDNTIELPRVCPNPTLPNGKRCTSTSFKPMEGRSEHADYQEIKVQEQMGSLAVGSIPRSIVVVLENDLVDAVKAGDDVAITGTVLHRWGRVSRGARCDLDLLIRANFVRVASSATGTITNVTDQLAKDFQHFWTHFASRPLQGRNVIVRSICPQLHGMYLAKLAVALVLMGGVGQLHADGTRTRGESHLLLIGDPGTGKSQFLRYACKVIPRSVLTTGIGTTSAGLTCTAVKDSGEWMLEAGALVLADRGLCCIDEFSSIREHDRTAIHEAMEQQTLSIAKAGLVCKLNSRCSIIAATNPKGKYDQNVDVSTNTAIASPLLSRFDLILVILDTNNAKWDEVVSSHILRQACIRGDELRSTIDIRTRALRDAVAKVGGAPVTTVWDHAAPAAPAKPAVPSTRNLELGADANGSTAAGGRIEDVPDGSVMWALERMQGYVQYAKSRFNPTLSRGCQEVLMKYYEMQRRTDSRSAARTTLRLLESLVRLAQAHARLMSRDVAGVQDGVIAVSLIETSMHASSLLATTPVLHATFPQDPDEEYVKQETMVLRRLGLSHLAASAGSASSGTDAVGSASVPADFALLSMFGGELPATATATQPSPATAETGRHPAPTSILPARPRPFRTVSMPLSNVQSVTQASQSQVLTADTSIVTDTPHNRAMITPDVQPSHPAQRPHGRMPSTSSTWLPSQPAAPPACAPASQHVVARPAPFPPGRAALAVDDELDLES